MTKIVIIFGLLIGAGALWLLTSEDDSALDLSAFETGAMEKIVTTKSKAANQALIESAETNDVPNSGLNSGLNSNINSAEINGGIESTFSSGKQNKSAAQLADNPDDSGNEREEAGEDVSVTLGEYIAVITPEIELSEKEYRDNKSNNENNQPLELGLPEEVVESSEIIEIGEVMSVDVLPDSTSTATNEIGTYIPVDEI